MESTASMPSVEGQICRIIKPLPDENPEDVFIICEDPTPFDPDENIYVTNLRELQRNIAQPLITSQIAVAKSDLLVIAENLDAYIATWNSSEK